ncbi:MAG: STAS domain-containing protein [Xanthomonadales bacterium]|nr:STAS domain-containing protein [Xanthomonadales bacterium]
MSAAAAIRISSADNAELSGDLTFKTVKDLATEAETLFGASKSIKQLDLSAVERVDSSGLALLLEWQASAKNRGALLQILHAPDDLISLAKLCEAEDLLQLQSRNLNDSSL